MLTSVNCFLPSNVLRYSVHFKRSFAKKFTFNFFFLCLLLSIASCKMLPSDDKKYPGLDKLNYKIQLNPKLNTTYYYDITNSTDINVEMNEKAVTNLNKSTVGLSYVITKDSAGNFTFTIHYDKIHIHAKNGEVETDADADNGGFAASPVQKMLSTLKAAKLVATVTPKGEIKDISGYKELATQLMASLDPNDSNAKTEAQHQLDQLIGEGMIKKNLNQLFTFLPDSVVHPNQQWQSSVKQQTDFNLSTTNYYTLKEASDATVRIRSEGKIQGNGASIEMMGYPVLPNLKGFQKGDYELETTTGMLSKSKVNTEIKGTIQIMGREVPVTIVSEVSIDAHKM